MHETDNRRFFSALNLMAEMFSDEMSELKQRGYWQIMQDRLTIEEWEYACTQAITRETFHKVPLPAVLLDYAREQRKIVTAAKEKQQLIEAQAARLALEATPAWQAREAERQAREKERRVAEAERQSQSQTWLETQPRSELIRLGLINPPNPSRWLPLEDESLDYEPREDPEHAKDRLRAQFRQLIETESTEDHDDA